MAILLLRHATAGHRSSWAGDDRLRPLDERGRRQAEGLAAALAPWPIARICTSPYVRCVETVQPLAEVRGLPIEERDELAEGAGREAALALIEELDTTPAVVCTHGDIVVDLLGDELKKGATAVLDPEDSLRTIAVLPRPA
jgi:phosphohistidine phosphatase SixA